MRSTVCARAAGEIFIARMDGWMDRLLRDRMAILAMAERRWWWHEEAMEEAIYMTGTVGTG
jgi:hypothetical protein